MQDNPGVMFVHRGSRTERLADELARQLETQRPANPLAAQTVVVAHPGLKRWLLGRLAERTPPGGGHPIAANYDMILPWQWFERTARRVLGDDALIGGAYRNEVLRWRLLAALPSLDAPELAAYLTGTDAARRSFQLAEHLSGLYTQYLIYRPEWVLEWEQRAPRQLRDWQARLWQHVQQAINRPHRARRSAPLLEALAADSTCSPALHVFGVSHLPPDVLQALRATALHTPVHLYFPDPCREYWSDLRSRRFQLAQDGDAEAMYYEVGHPLLVALGRVAQDFCITLDECDAQIERDALDEAEPLPGADSLLARLQSSIRCLQPELVGAPTPPDAEQLLQLREDGSLRVHACHTRLRELEVLKDNLLRCLADDPGLQHSDIVVMAPDIGAYAPYLPALFGEPARYVSDPLQIPWHLADVGLARAHPLMSAFAQLLDLAESRFSLSEMLDFLDVPAVARRFHIDASGRDALERWLRRAHVAWGLDASMKSEAGAAATDAHSWQFGFDRLYAGMIVGNDPGDGHDVDMALRNGESDMDVQTSGAMPDAGPLDGGLLDGILPLEGVSGNAVEVIGQFDRLLTELRRARDGFAQARPLAEWSAWLLERIEALFLPEPRDDEANSALDTLRRLVAGLGSQADEAGVTTPMPWSVVREALRGGLDAVPERQSFLLGGVTFCGLVPQRSIPFRVVALLGMNEGEFPRPGNDAGINLILKKPRRGDRDTRSEDRYLFLEALMSARDALHISYVGEGVRDGKPRNPAAPLAELLQFLDEQYQLAGDDASGRPWLLRHPLQPFDARYFEHGRTDARLFSYQSAYVQAPRGAEASPFADGPRALPVDAPAEEIGDITLAALKRYWRDPARDSLLHGHGISLQALDDDGGSDREPLETRLDPLERADHRLLMEALTRGRQTLPAQPPPWLAHSGLLAGGAIGAQSWLALRASVQLLLSSAVHLFAHGRAQAVPQAIDLGLGEGRRITGVVERVFQAADGGLLLFDARPGGAMGFRELLAFFIDWAALRLTPGTTGPETWQAAFVEHPKGRKAPQLSPLLAPVLAQDDGQLKDGLRQLIDAALRARQQPLLFFPRTALAWACVPFAERANKARNAWEGDGFHQIGERDYAPGYAALLGRGLDLFNPASPAHADFISATELVCQVIDPDRTMMLQLPEPADAR